MSLSTQNAWPVNAPIRTGLFAITALVLGLGLWGNYAHISGAVIASGVIQVESFNQVVQHPKGGVVSQILVKDGDHVPAGAVLLKFNDTAIKSQIAIFQGQFFQTLAQKSRLNAEQIGADHIQFDPQLLDAAIKRAPVQALLQAQQTLFESRLSTVAKEHQQLIERKRQLEKQVQGIDGQIQAIHDQNHLITRERASQQKLLDKGLTQSARVLTLMREEARLDGEKSALKVLRARADGQIAEITIEILKLPAQRQEEALDAIRDLQFREIELSERLIVARQTLSSLDVRAPMSGVIYGLQVHAVRAVIRPADQILQIVPSSSPLIIAVRIQAHNINQVHIGQDALLRFPAFDQRVTPEIFGQITAVSADALIDEATGISYYSGEIQPNKTELDKLNGMRILPGMPVESYIKTGSRTPVSFLLKPFADYFRRALRES